MALSNNYRYLFPYEKIPLGCRILIYGAGNMGQDYLSQLLITGYCTVVAMADKNYAKYPPMVVPIINPKRISDYSFDYVVIALRVAVADNEIRHILNNQGVPNERIISIFERHTENVNIFSEFAQKNVIDLSCNKYDISIALLIAGGWGDHVIQKRFVVELMRTAPDVSIDIYAIRHEDFIKYLFSDCKNVTNVIEDIGCRYNAYRSCYSLSISIEACHYVRVDEYKRDILQIRYPKLIKSIDILVNETRDENIDLRIPVHISNQIRLYRGLNAYSGFNYNGAFDIRDKKVSIPISEKGEKYIDSLGLSNYMTINYGSGECTDENMVAKMWPFERFERTCGIIKNKYPKLNIVQLGADGAPELENADMAILGQSIENVVSLLKGSILHLDIEGGLVHIATQLGTKCIVLFGPTVEEYYGYSDNIVIRNGNCRNCWGLYSDVNRCARKMEKPECMYGITVEMVSEAIDSYLSKFIQQ